MRTTKFEALFLIGATLAHAAFVRADSDTQRADAEGPYMADMGSLKQYQCPDWFRDAKFGIWAHWGPQSVPMEGDWYAKNLCSIQGVQPCPSASTAPMSACRPPN